MSITVRVPTEEDKTVFIPDDSENTCVSISPNGQYCCFLLFDRKPWSESPNIAKALQFVDLSQPDREKKIFRFARDSYIHVASVYWLTSSYLVFLTVDGTSFKQIMFKLNLEEKKFFTKICERFYQLPNEIATDDKMSRARQVMFHGEGYIAWTEHRKENSSCTGLYLIPRNPIHSELRLRKFVMFISMRNPVVQANERIQIELDEWPEDYEIVGPPFVRNNKLLFWFHDEFRHVIFGVFLAVDIEKLIEVKGLNYDPIEIENETSAYSMEEWTSLINREDEIYSRNCSPMQVGKYLMLSEHPIRDSATSAISIINLEDLSFSVVVGSKSKVNWVVLHPFGFLLTFKLISKSIWNNAKLRIGKKNRTLAWKGSSLKDLVRRYIILNPRISQNAQERYKKLIYSS